MKKALVFFSLFVSCGSSYAQVTVNIQLPPAGLVQKNQLWNIVLVNNGQVAIEASVRMMVQDAKTGVALMSASTGSFQLAKGMRSFSDRDLAPIIYNYNNLAFEKQYLPMGHYLLCYQVNDMKLGELKVIAEECVPFSVEPLSPPLLHMPSDKTTLQEQNPNFTWMPPTPVMMFDNLTYDLILAEIYTGQQPVEAIQNNNPVYFKTGIRSNTEIYPSTYTKLDTGKVYAWMVVAKNDLDYAANSEVWTFRISNNKTTPISSGDYFVLNSGLQSTHVLRNEMLRIKYYSYAFPYKAAITVLNQKKKVVARWDRQIQTGENYLEFPLNRKFSKNETYSFELKGPDGKLYDLKFMLN